MQSGSSNTMQYTPPGTLKTLDTEELQQWALEAALGRGIPMERTETLTWQRRQRNGHALPSWVVPGTPAPPAPSTVPTRMLPATKRSFWKKQPYDRTLRVVSNEFGPLEFATLHPKTGRVTNTWYAEEVLEICTFGITIFLALPGSWWGRARSLLQIQMESADAAAAILASWGWEREGAEDGAAVQVQGAVHNPPVVTDDGDVFVFRHD